MVTNLHVMRYSKLGKKEDLDNCGNLLVTSEKFVLVNFSSRCSDILEQKSNLEELAVGLGKDDGTGIYVLFTLKFYCELSGEGI